MSRRDKITTMLEENPDDLFLNYALAMELVKEDEVEEARVTFAKVRSLDVNYVAAYFQEGQLLAQDDQMDDAKAILQEGIAVAQRIGDSHALGEMTEFLETL